MIGIVSRLILPVPGAGQWKMARGETRVDMMFCIKCFAILYYFRKLERAISRGIYCFGLSRSASLTLDSGNLLIWHNIKSNPLQMRCS